jgi:hypothetical protein
MDRMSAATLARELGTSVPRVTRAAIRLGLEARQPSGRYVFTPRQAGSLRRALGVSPRAAGLTRSEIAVLAALRNAPFGLVSARAVARRSGLSATAAARALDVLRAEGLVDRSSEMVAAGRAREMTIWRANLLHPQWPALDPVLEQVERPERPNASRQTEARVPRRLRHLFWNTADSQLDVRHAGPYIARRLLQTMDLQGLAWGAQALAPKDWKRAGRARGLDPKARQLARNLAESPSRPAGRLRPRLAMRASIDSVDVANYDLMAMKLKVMAERGEMRDYFDVKAIDEKGSVSVEEGVELYMRRYDIDPGSDALPHLYQAMGDLSDVEVDDLLPVDLAELQRWWSARQVRVLRNSDRFG